MRQLSPDSLSFTPMPGEMPRGRLTIGDREAEIPGGRIEVAYAMDDSDPISGYLFFSSDDILYEDVLSITLTDPDLRILDQAWIGAPYATALWTDARMAAPGQIEFRLEGDGTWRLTLLPRPEWRLPLPGTDGWVWRKMTLRRHFRIDRIGPDA